VTVSGTEVIGRLPASLAASRSRRCTVASDTQVDTSESLEGPEQMGTLSARLLHFERVAPSDSELALGLAHHLAGTSPRPRSRDRSGLLRRCRRIDTASGFEGSPISQQALLARLAMPAAGPTPSSLGSISELVERVEESKSNASVALADGLAAPA
jgi:hypothetical protein